MPVVIDASHDIYCKPRFGADNIPIDIFNPKAWGPSCWQFLHISSLCYPQSPSEEYKTGMRHFILGLGYSLPCEGCQTECLRYVYTSREDGTLEHALSSRDNLFEFFWELHNRVNKRNGCREYTLEEAKNLYKKRYICGSDYTKWVCMILGLIIIIIIIKTYLNK